MKRKIAILGSTGSIGRTLLDIIAKDKKLRKIVHGFQINIAYNPPKKYDGSCLDGRDITYNIIPDAIKLDKPVFIDVPMDRVPRPKQWATSAPWRKPQEGLIK